jgi:hypothetical protein
MNPDYVPEHSRWEHVRTLRKDLEMLRLKLMYADLFSELNFMSAMLQLKRGCRR